MEHQVAGWIVHFQSSLLVYPRSCCVSILVSRDITRLKMKRTGALAVGVTNVAKKPKLLDAYFAKPASTDADDSKPKPTPGESTVTPQFDKTAWIAGLTETQRDTLKLEIDTLDDSWLSVLHGELTKPYFLGLKKFLKEEKEKSKTIYPAVSK